MARALTICQPYAELIATGRKRVENRGWPTTYRGLIYIHAGKSRKWLELSEDGTKDQRYDIPISRMEFGAIVAVATLKDCLHINRISAGEYDAQYPWLKSHEHAEGPWCWVLDGVSAIGPWPWNGKLGLWYLDEIKLSRVANWAQQTQDDALEN